MFHSLPPRIRFIAWTAVLLSSSAVGHAGAAETAPARAKYETLSVTGKVVWLSAALRELHGVRTVLEASERTLVLVTAEGELHPIIEDTRGRAFRADPRLRDKPLELLVRRHRGSPLLQVIKVHALEDAGKFELDYWCDICAIAMVELKLCDCCQGTTELRRRKR